MRRRGLRLTTPPKNRTETTTALVQPAVLRDRSFRYESARSAMRGVQNTNICAHAPRCGTPNVGRPEPAI
jgi:hypothetical protein